MWLTIYFQAEHSLHIPSIVRGGPGAVAGRDGRQGAGLRATPEALGRQSDLPRRGGLQLYPEMHPSPRVQR